LNGPKGVAVDAAGDIFIADTGDGRVVEVAANGTQRSDRGLRTSNSPQGLAVDGAGDLFIADNNLNEVVEVPAWLRQQRACQSHRAQPFGPSSQPSWAWRSMGQGDLFIG
jgi:DNA-binding beta-propeller fold protein YncE